jgi:hypothetical protein
VHRGNHVGEPAGRLAGLAADPDHLTLIDDHQPQRHLLLVAQVLRGLRGQLELPAGQAGQQLRRQLTERFELHPGQQLDRR